MRRTLASLAGAGAPKGAAGGLSRATMNKEVIATQYAVRGELVLRAMAHAKALERREARPFDKLVYCNIGNPQELRQAPITFFRQVLALTCYPPLIDAAPSLRGPGGAPLFAPDAVERARRYMATIPGGTGAYSNSQGIEVVRQEVADFITARDGPAHPANAGDIFLTDGASPAVQMMIRALIRDEADTILIPIPQYPLYSASIALYGGSLQGYYLTEGSGWGLDPAALTDALAKARAAGKNVRAVAVINPGNPTGGVLSEANIRQVLSFAAANGLVVLADEVYQENVWAGSGVAPATTTTSRAAAGAAAGPSFVSFRRVAIDMGLVDPTATTTHTGVQLASFHSVSKGFTGECGRRGGYMELLGFDEGVRSELYKLASVSLCANVTGQVMVGLQCNPPRPGTPSHGTYAAERDAILSSLQRRAVKLVAGLNALEGVSCQAPQGALYVFPTVALPPMAVAAAAAAGKPADTFYCLALLDATGLVVVPGSGFGQADGTWHFRSTILPPEDEMDGVIAKLSAFHKGFMDKYR